MVEPRILQQTALRDCRAVSLYRVHEISAAGSIALAMFVSVMIGGGMLYIDDKARGVHEGYLVTPITKLELVLGLEPGGRDQGRDDGGRHHGDRIAAGGRGHDLQSLTMRWACWS